MRMEALHKKIEKIKNIIGSKLEGQRKNNLKAVTKEFSKELKEIKALQGKLETIKKTTEQKLPAGYSLYGHSISNSSCYNDELIPKEDRKKLQKANELLSIDKKEEAEKLLRQLVKNYKIGQ